MSLLIYPNINFILDIELKKFIRFESKQILPILFKNIETDKKVLNDNDIAPQYIQFLFSCIFWFKIIDTLNIKIIKLPSPIKSDKISYYIKKLKKIDTKNQKGAATITSIRKIVTEFYFKNIVKDISFYDNFFQLFYNDNLVDLDSAQNSANLENYQIKNKIKDNKLAFVHYISNLIYPEDSDVNLFITDTEKVNVNYFKGNFKDFINKIYVKYNNTIKIATNTYNIIDLEKIFIENGGFIFREPNKNLNFLELLKNSRFTDIIFENPGEIINKEENISGKELERLKEISPEELYSILNDLNIPIRKNENTNKYEFKNLKEWNKYLRNMQGEYSMEIITEIFRNKPLLTLIAFMIKEANNKNEKWVHHVYPKVTSKYKIYDYVNPYKVYRGYLF